MPVFDFNNKPDKNSHGKCTYTMVFSNASEASAESPILLLDNKIRQWKHHSCGVFTNPVKRTSFEFEEEDGYVEQKHVSVSWLDLADSIEPVLAANGEPIKDRGSLIDFSR